MPAASQALSRAIAPSSTNDRSSSGQTADGRTGAGNGRIKGEEKKAQRRSIPEREKLATKTTFSGDRSCFSLWLCRNLSFAALRLMTRLFQPNGLFDQISGKKKRPATKFCVLDAWQPARFLGNRCSVGVMICSNTGLASEYQGPRGHSSKKPGHLSMAATSPREI